MTFLLKKSIGEFVEIIMHGQKRKKLEVTLFKICSISSHLILWGKKYDIYVEIKVRFFTMLEFYQLQKIMI